MLVGVDTPNSTGIVLSLLPSTGIVCLIILMDAALDLL